MNFWQSSALKGVAVAACAVLAGCGTGDGNAEFEQGKAAYAVRDLVKADKLFAEALDCAPANVDRLVSAARVKLDLGQLPAAKELIERAALNGDGESDLVLLASQISWHLKDYSAAGDGFAAVGNNTKLEPAVRSQGWAGLGVVEMSRDNFHLARVAFLRAIRLDRRNAAAWYHLGLLYRDSFGYLEAALEQFDIYVRLEAEATPRVQKVQRTVIPALKEMISKSVSERPGVTKRDSNACAAALAKAEAALAKGTYKTARSAYQTALDADPISYPAALGLAKAWEKSDATKVGQQKAFEYYKLACALSPSAVATFRTAGALALRLGYNSQAVEIYSRAVAASPTSLDSLDGLVRAMRKAGYKTALVDAYQRYRDTLPAKASK